MNKIYPADVKALSDMTDDVEALIDAAGAGLKQKMQLMVSLEEIFVNIALYAYPEKNGNITVSADIDDGVLTVIFTDSGNPFNPLMRKDPDITLDAEERDIGGLGIYIVKKTMDDVKYEYCDGKNILTLCKKLEVK